MLWYLHLARKTLPPADVKAIVPASAEELWYFNKLAEHGTQLNERPELAGLSDPIVFFSALDFAKAAEEHSWIEQSRAIAWRDSASTEFTLAWGFPGGWSQQQCEQWCLSVFGAKPIKNSVFEVNVAGRGAVLKVVAPYALLGYNEPQPPASEDRVSPLVELLAMGTKRGIVHIANDEQAKVIPWIGAGSLSSTIVQDLYMANHQLRGEEIVVVNGSLPKLVAIPEAWLRWIPSSVNSFTGVGLETGYEWIEYQQRLRTSEGSIAAWNGELAALETQYSTDADRFLVSWWNGGMGVYTAFEREYLILGTVDAAASRRGLASAGGGDVLPFLDGSYVQLPDDRLLTHLIGAPGKGKRAAWVGQRTVVFSDSEASLLKLAARLAGEKSVESKHLLARAIASGEGMVAYCQSGSSAQNPLVGLRLDSLAVGGQTNAIHVVYSGAVASTGRIVTRFEVSAEASSKPVNRYVWEYAVPGLRQETLTSIKNHTDNSWYVLVQDTAHVVHAIDARGRLMWTYDAGAPIVGTIVGIDMYKNGKVQSIFATHEAVHAIDVLGRKPEGFPIRPRSGSRITSPLFVADYDNNRNYRLLFGTADGELLNYTVDGKTVRGWNYKRKGPAVSHVSHLRAGTADYLFVGYGDGRVDLLKRNGEPRYASRLKLPQYSSAPVFRVTSDIARSSVIVVDTTGAVVEGVFGQPDGKVAVLVGAAEACTGALLLTDINRDRMEDLFYTTDTAVIGMVGGSEFHRSFRSKVLPDLRSYQFSDGERIGVVLPEAREFYLLESDGTTADGYPLFAGGIAVIRDLTARGGLDLVTTDGRDLVMVYRLE